MGEKKEPRHLLSSLHNIKKMENETIDEFNTKFRRVVADLLSPELTIVISVIEWVNFFILVSLGLQNQKFQLSAVN